MVKLDMYRKFTNALAVAVIVSVGWICYEVIISTKTHLQCDVTKYVMETFSNLTIS